MLSDIHGNLPALEAVLADIDRRGVESIILNGDLATGPMPAQTLDRLAALGSRAFWVRGNADREVVTAYDGELSPDLPAAGRAPTEYTAAQLSSQHRDLMDELPLSVVLRSTGSVWRGSATPQREATPRSCSSIPRWTVIARRSPTPTNQSSCWTTPTCRSTASQTDAGSSTQATWGCRTATAGYDAAAAALTFRTEASEYPGLEDFIRDNIETVPSDVTALAVFSK